MLVITWAGITTAQPHTTDFEFSMSAMTHAISIGAFMDTDDNNGKLLGIFVDASNGQIVERELTEEEIEEIKCS